MKGYRSQVNHGGFTLVELLVVVIIIGILASVAIPVFLAQRERSREAALQSTLRSAATYMEVVAEEAEGEYPSSLSPLAAQGFRFGEVTIEDADFLVDNVAGFYCIDAIHAEDAGVSGRFDSRVGAPELGESGSRPSCSA